MLVTQTAQIRIQAKATSQLSYEKEQEGLAGSLKTGSLHIGQTATDNAPLSNGQTDIAADTLQPDQLPATISTEASAVSIAISDGESVSTLIGTGLPQSQAPGIIAVTNSENTAVIEITSIQNPDTQSVCSTENIKSVNVQSKDIQGLFHASKFKSVFSGTEVVIKVVESVTLLLTNGWAYIGLSQSPLDLPIEPQSEASTSWAQWRAAAEGGYEIAHRKSGRWQKIQGTEICTKPITPLELAGSYSRSITQTWGTTTWTNRSGLKLTGDGQFMISDSSLVSSGGPGSMASQASVNVYSASDKAGSRQVFSSQTLSPPGGESINIYSNDQIVETLGHKFGVYQLLDDGVTLEMQFANGDVKRQLFLRTGTRALVNNSSYSFSSNKSTVVDYESLMVMNASSTTKPDESEWMEKVAENAKKDSLERSRGGGEGMASGEGDGLG